MWGSRPLWGMSIRASGAMAPGDIPAGTALSHSHIGDWKFPHGLLQA